LFMICFSLSFPNDANARREADPNTYHKIVVENRDGAYIANVNVTVHFHDGTLPSHYSVRDLERIGKPKWEIKATNVSEVEFVGRIRTLYPWDPKKKITSKPISVVPERFGNQPNIRLTLGGTYKSPAIGAFSER